VHDKTGFPDRSHAQRSPARNLENIGSHPKGSSRVAESSDEFANRIRHHRRAIPDSHEVYGDVVDQGGVVAAGRAQALERNRVRPAATVYAVMM
jgi:hypothetical protein